MLNKNIILIQPRSGSYDNVVVDPPLGLLYAALLARKYGYKITLIDTRIDTKWKTSISNAMDRDTLLVGLSVMSGRPIHYALEISRFIKQYFDVPVLWGGPHATLAPANVLMNPYIDYVCRGDGEEPLYNLVRALDEYEDKNRIPYGNIRGIGYKREGKIFHGSVMKREKIANWKDIPYDLLNHFSYHRFNSNERIFPVLTSIGCLHKCSFCYLSSEEMSHNWLAYKAEEVIEYLSFIIKKFNATYISIIDNDFFASLTRAKRIFELIKQQRWDVQFGFRGARIDELDSMDESMLKLMEEIGVKHLHIGVESGSQKMLNFYRKGIKVKQVIKVNRKLSKLPGLLPSYNFFGGTPSETLSDMKQSAKLVRILVNENPHCQISSFNQYVPYPGSELNKIVTEKYGFQPPITLEEWASYDDTEVAKKQLPWLDNSQKELLLAMNFIGVFMDRKIPNHFTQKTPKHAFYRLSWRMLNLLAKFRINHLFFKFPIEYYAFRAYHHFLDSHFHTHIADALKGSCAE